MNRSEVIIKICALEPGSISSGFVYSFEVRSYESENNQFDRKDSSVEDDGRHKGGSRCRLRGTDVRPTDESVVEKPKREKRNVHSGWQGRRAIECGAGIYQGNLF